MKTFRVYLKEGKSLIVRATRFEVTSTYSMVTFFKSDTGAEGEKDSDIFIKYDQIVAILPEPERQKDDETTPGSFGYQTF
jgi:hypothetical protein